MLTQIYNYDGYMIEACCAHCEHIIDHSVLLHAMHWLTWIEFLVREFEVFSSSC
jgi:hypothetical protein